MSHKNSTTPASVEVSPETVEIAPIALTLEDMKAAAAVAAPLVKGTDYEVFVVAAKNGETKAYDASPSARDDLKRVLTTERPEDLLVFSDDPLRHDVGDAKSVLKLSVCGNIAAGLLTLHKTAILKVPERAEDVVLLYEKGRLCYGIRRASLVVLCEAYAAYAAWREANIPAITVIAKPSKWTKASKPAPVAVDDDGEVPMV